MSGSGLRLSERVDCSLLDGPPNEVIGFCVREDGLRVFLANGDVMKASSDMEPQTRALAQEELIRCLAPGIQFRPGVTYLKTWFKGSGGEPRWSFAEDVQLRAENAEAS